MPTIQVPYLNIALDCLSLIVILIVTAACVGTNMKTRSRTGYFSALLIFISLSLIADMISWFGEGHPDLQVMTVIGNTAASDSIVFSRSFGFIVPPLFGKPIHYTMFHPTVQAKTVVFTLFSQPYKPFEEHLLF